MITSPSPNQKPQKNRPQTPYGYPNSLPPPVAGSTLGPPVEFWIAGQTASAAKNDGEIEAMLAGQNAGDVKLTVFHFGQAVLKITPVSSYELVVKRRRKGAVAILEPVMIHKKRIAVRFKVSAQLEPAALMSEYATAPALKVLKVGMVQNVLKGTKNEAFYRFARRVIWPPGAPFGSFLNAPSTYQPWHVLSRNTVDTSAGTLPIYPQINPSGPYSVKPGAIFSSTDSPHTSALVTYMGQVMPYYLPGVPHPVGTATPIYNLKNLTMNAHLDDWCVITKGEIVMDVVARNSWSVVESKTHLAKAAVGGQGTGGRVPVLIGSTANSVVQGAQNNPNAYSASTIRIVKK